MRGRYGGGGRYGGFYGGRRRWRGGGFYRPRYYRSGCLGCATYALIIMVVAALALILLL